MANDNKFQNIKVAAITYSAPWGFAELFVIRELREIKRICPSLLITPLVPKGDLFHEISKELKDNCIRLPLINAEIAMACIRYGILNTKKFANLLSHILIKSRSLRILIRNLAVIPKSIYFAEIFEKIGINHIRVNWATTPATMGYIISSITGIPWSLRTHRWDIYEDNMLEEKIKSADFVICNSEKTKQAVLKIAGENYAQKIYVKALGMYIDEMNSESITSRIRMRRDVDRFHIVTPANLVSVKGHRYLLEACSYLKKRGYGNFHLTLFGNGPLERAITSMIDSMGLVNLVTLHTSIPNNELLDLYRNNHVDLVVLPSIVTETGEHEGLPTVLMEAMSFGIPVISTNTGGIPELLANNAGIIVREKSGKELADAIERLMLDEALAIEISLNERNKMETQYDIQNTALWMVDKY